MTKNKKIVLIIAAFIIVFLVLPNFVLAADATQTVDLSTINPLKQYCPGGKCDPAKLIGGIIKAALGIVGSIALLMFIYGGFLWLTSQGNEQKIAKGKSVIVWAVIGLAVIFLSYAAVNFVVSALTGSGQQTTTGGSSVPEMTGCCSGASGCIDAPSETLCKQTLGPTATFYPGAECDLGNTNACL